MTEKKIKAEAIKVLEKSHYKYWFPPNVRYLQRDIFGLFDFIAINQSKNLVLVQITTKANMSARHNKIFDWTVDNNCFFDNAYVWGWEEKIKSFLMENA